MIEKLQLGGGKKEWPGWLNLDETSNFPFFFQVDNKFPLKDKSQILVYSSHLLEHLAPFTVEYVLREVHRVLKPQHDFVIKIPDFELVLAKWRAKDEKFFNKWGIQKVVPSWKNMGVPDTINFRCSMIFCGFWEEGYGHHFKNKRNIESYHGPVPMKEHELIDLLNVNNPSIISATLRQMAEKEQGITFNHQSAWSKQEFHNLLRKHNFFVRTYMDKEACHKEYVSVPDIKDKSDISLYVSCYKI